MKMITVDAYRQPGLVNAPDLVGLKGNSYWAIADQLEIGDVVTIEVKGKGYKQLSKELECIKVQRNYAYEY